MHEFRVLDEQWILFTKILVVMKVNLNSVASGYKYFENIIAWIVDIDNFI